MGYKDIYKNNKVVSLYDETASGTFKFTKDNPQILGKFIRQDTYKKTIFSKGSIMYTFDTDTGEKTFFLSGATDNIIRNTLIPGQIYSILYLGTKKTSKNHDMKNFRIEHIMDVPKPDTEKKKVVRRRRIPPSTKRREQHTEVIQKQEKEENGEINTPST